MKRQSLLQKKLKSIKCFGNEIGGLCEVFEVREGCVTLKRKHTVELNDRICREEVEVCLK